MHLHEGIRYNKFLKSLTCISELVMFYLIVRLVSANHEHRRHFTLIIEPAQLVNHKVWQSPSNNMAVVIQQYGGRHPIIRRLPFNNTAVATQQRVNGHERSMRPKQRIGRSCFTTQQLAELE